MTVETTGDTATDNTSAADATNTDDTAKGSTTPNGSDGEPQTTDNTEGNDNTDDANPDGDKSKEDATKGDVPEAYDFAMPDGMDLDQGLADKATPIFKELGLTNDQASKLVGLYAAHMKEASEGSTDTAEQWRAQRNAEEAQERSATWLESVKADKEIGGANFEPVKNRVIEAIGAVGTPEMKEAFNTFGWGNHPELVRLVARLIDYTPEDRGERPGSGGSAKSTAAVLFDHPTSRQT